MYNYNPWIIIGLLFKNHLILRTSKTAEAASGKEGEAEKKDDKGKEQSGDKKPAPDKKTPDKKEKK